VTAVTPVSYPVSAYVRKIPVIAISFIAVIAIYFYKTGSYFFVGVFIISEHAMSDFSSNLPSSKLDSSQKEQLMEQVKAQIAVANAQEILHVSCRLIFS